MSLGEIKVFSRERVLAAETWSQGIIKVMSLDLPAPVQRFFQYAIQTDQIIRSAKIQQTGEMRFGKDKKWMKIEADQFISTEPREFRWNAVIRMMKVLRINVTDSYRSGFGSSEIRFFSTRIAKEENIPQLNSGALQRYLGEAIWVPTTLLPGNGISWKAIDSSTAEVTLTDSGIEESLRFHFNEAGKICQVSTERRYRKEGKGYVLRPWKVDTSSYRDFQGFRIPTQFNVTWTLSGEDFCWFRANITKVLYEFQA